jgi:hypothetical protein
MAGPTEESPPQLIPRTIAYRSRKGKACPVAQATELCQDWDCVYYARCLGLTCAPNVEQRSVTATSHQVAPLSVNVEPLAEAAWR